MGLTLIKTDKNITLNEMVARVADERDVRIGRSALNNWLRRCGFTYKKTAHALEQERSEVLRKRQAWFDNQLDFDPARLVFIDETGLSTKIARLPGRSKRGECCRAGIPPRALEDNPLYRRASADRNDRADGA